MTFALMLAVLCPHPVVGQGIQLCMEGPPASSRDVLRFLADRGYPLAVFLLFRDDTALVDEGPLVLARDLRVLPSLPLSLPDLTRGVFRLSAVLRLVRWLEALGITTRLSWEGTRPVLRWSLPPPRGSVALTWDGQRFLGEGRLSGWLARGFVQASLSVEGYGDRERARISLLRPLRPLLEARGRAAYDNTDVPTLSGEVGLQIRREKWVAGSGVHLVWDTVRKVGGVLWTGVNRPQDTLTLWGLVRRDGFWIRGNLRISRRFAEAVILIQEGTLQDSALAEPRGGVRALHGWPESGMFLQGSFVRLGIGPRRVRLLGEGLWERGATHWSLAVRLELQGVHLWLSRGLPDGRTWVYVSLPMG